MEDGGRDHREKGGPGFLRDRKFFESHKVVVLHLLQKRQPLPPRGKGEVKVATQIILLVAIVVLHRSCSVVAEPLHRR